MDILVYFIKSNTDQKVNDALQQAFKIIEQQVTTPPVWINTKRCLEIKEKNRNEIFIFDRFDGEGFLNLKSVGCRIYGPYCVLHCFQDGVAFPRLPYPIFCNSMEGMVICCTGIKNDKRKMYHELINFMNGSVSKEFTEEVTQLVAEEVGSKKYLVAANMGKDIMLPDWIEAVWESSQCRLLNAKNEEFDKYKCPIFHKTVVTVSGLDQQEKEQAKSLVTEAGGTYTGDMKMNDCTHLVVTEPKGKKYNFAIRWNLLIVTPKWIYDSVKLGYRQDEKLYGVQRNSSPKAAMGPPSKHSSSPNVSTINTSSACAFTTINETGMTSDTTMVLTTQDLIPDQSKAGPIVELDNLDLNSPHVLCKESFLEGCKVYATGFTQQQHDKIKKLLNLGAATRYVQLNENVSHLIKGEKEVDMLHLSTFKPYIVSVGWLMESLKQGHPVDESNFCVHSNNDEKLPTLKVEETITSSSFTKPAPVAPQKFVEDDMEEILSQYLPGGPSTSRLQNPDMTEPGLPVVNSTFIGGHGAASALQNADTTATVTSFVNTNDLSSDETKDTLPFHGKRFVAYGFDAEQLEFLGENVTEMGGEYIAKNVKCVPDFAVVPLFGYPVNVTVVDVATIAWLERCIEEEKLLPVDSHVLFRPLVSLPGSRPLTDCVITISGFEGCMRNCLNHVAEELGASIQIHLSRRAKASLMASTHLLVNVPGGIGSSKYTAAMEWGIPIVTERWLYECARTGTKADITDIKNVEQDESIPAAVPDVFSSPSGKENYGVSSVPCYTPKPVYSRIKEMQDDKHTPILSPDVTPSQFLNANKPYFPKFDCSAAFAALNAMSSKRRKSTPLRDIVSRNLTIAVENMGIDAEYYKETSHAAGAEEAKDDTSSCLVGVVIAVSKKLSSKQGDYNNIAASLGADYRWTYDNSVTHLLYQGRGNDKEFRLAKSQKKFILSPYWLLMCKEQGERADESLFPHSYNPQMSLSVTTPVRTLFRETPDSNKHQKKAAKLKESDTEINPSNVAEDEHQPVEVMESEDQVMETFTDSALGSLEVNKVLSKQMEDLINATKGQKPERRKSRRLNSFGTINSSSNESASNSSETKHGRSKQIVKSDEIEKDQGSKPEGGMPPESQCEPSQNIEVTWDDPTGRLEKQKLANELERAFSTTQTNNDFQIPAMFPSENSAKENNLLSKNIDKRPITPEPPSLTFPRPKPGTSIPSPQPIQLIEEVKPCEPKVPPVFLLSGMSVAERDNYGALIEELGGECRDAQHFHPGCTHLVIKAPTRNEKYLACVASGKWVLHISYFEACKQAGKFVDENEHEWGGSGTEGMKNLSTLSSKLAVAASHWREKLSLEQNTGAFHSWNVILCCDKAKENGFRRLLEAGGARVLATRPPFQNFDDCTHVFIELNKVSFKVPVEDFVKAGIHCLKPDYIASFLTDNPEMMNYYINESAASVSRSKDVTIPKRKGSDSINDSHDVKKQKTDS